jgi:hypothetical protein
LRSPSEDGGLEELEESLPSRRSSSATRACSVAIRRACSALATRHGVAMNTTNVRLVRPTLPLTCQQPLVGNQIPLDQKAAAGDISEGGWFDKRSRAKETYTAGDNGSEDVLIARGTSAASGA